MAIGLGLLTILALIFANSSRSQKEITLTAQQVENGRYAIELLSDDLRHAGFYGYYTPPNPTTLTALVDPCSLVLSDLLAGIELPVQGYDSPSTSPLSCLASANHVPGTDVLVVRRASTVATASASLNSNIVYLQTAVVPAASRVVALGSDPSVFNLTVRNGTGSPIQAPIRQLETHIYFVSPCSTPTGSSGTVCTATDDGGSPIPTLKRMELTAGASGSTLLTYALVEGIENFQVDYGGDSDDDGAPNGPMLSIPALFADWQNVVAVRLHVLARNTTISPGYTDTKTYSLGGTSVTPGGQYRRHLYSSMVRVKNPSERREVP